MRHRPRDPDAVGDEGSGVELHDVRAEARTAMRSSNAALSIRRPSRAIASTCACRPTSVTARPARASMPPK
jgi:D-alanyl-D-alanine dipeptidase